MRAAFCVDMFKKRPLSVGSKAGIVARLRDIVFVVVVGYTARIAQLLKKGTWLIHRTGDRAPLAARDGSEVARTKS